MSRYDGLIIPRSYSEYLNKTDSATLSQMLQQLTGLWSHAVSEGDNKPVTSDAVYEALTDAATIQQALQVPGVLSENVAAGDNKAVTSNAVNGALTDYRKFKRKFINPAKNDWGLTEFQILSTDDFITLLEEKGFLATESDTTYRNCTLAFRHFFGAQIYLQLSSIRVSLTSAVINCESLYDGEINWRGFRKITIIGINYIITYTMAGWNYFAKTS